MDEREDYEPEAGARSEPVTERVRIIGAQPAGAASGRVPEEQPGTTEPTLPGMTGAGATGAAAWTTPASPPAVPEAAGPAGPVRAEEAGRAAPSGRNGGDPLDPGVPGQGRADGEQTGVPDMPHWTDPPTGQVPAVLDRRAEEGEASWAAGRDTGPAWREHNHEWADSGFDPSLLADDETRVGALEETPVEERRPWEFDDLRAPAAGRTGAEAGGSRWDLGGSRWDEGEGAKAAPEPTPSRPPVVPASPAAAGGQPPSAPPSPPERVPTRSPEDGPASGAEDRGVASISSSPLRFGTRDPFASPTQAPARGRAARPGAVAPATAGAGEGSGRDMPVAIATGIGFVVLAFVCFALGSLATLVLTAVVVALAAAEYNKALRRSKRHPAALVVLVATVGVMVAAYGKGPSAIPLVTALMVVATMVWYLAGADRGPAVEGIAVSLLGFVWIGVLGAFAALMLAPSQYPHRHGVAFMLGAVVAAVGADVGGLAVGSWLGRRPLAPSVSPHKTWEGVIGGGLVAIAVSAALTGQVHPWTVPKAALLGLVVAVVAPLGDLCESLIKRDLGLKDMGSVLPGHGGVLDRVDAILFALPATYYLVRVLNLG